MVGADCRQREATSSNLPAALRSLVEESLPSLVKILDDEATPPRTAKWVLELVCTLGGQVAWARRITHHWTPYCTTTTTSPLTPSHLSQLSCVALLPTGAGLLRSCNPVMYLATCPHIAVHNDDRCRLDLPSSPPPSLPFLFRCCQCSCSDTTTGGRGARVRPSAQGVETGG